MARGRWRAGAGPGPLTVAMPDMAFGTRSIVGPRRARTPNHDRQARHGLVSAAQAPGAAVARTPDPPVVPGQDLREFRNQA